MAKILSKEFLEQYEDFPDEMTKLGKFIYYRTYSRYLEMENSIRPFDESLISKYEMELDFDIDGLECENGICPIR